jgi:hypothetical protein
LTATGNPDPVPTIETCPNCDSEQIIVTVQIAGEPMSMTVCSSCLRKRWYSESESVGLDRVLDRLRLVPTRRQRTEAQQLPRLARARSPTRDVSQSPGTGRRRRRRGG